MSAASEIMSPKKVVTLRAESRPTALDAVRLMVKNRIGSVVVVDGRDRPAGIITERDVLKKVARANKKAQDIRAEEIMSSPLVTIKSYDSIDTAAATMAKHRIKRVVVLEDDGRVAGVLSVTDIAKRLAKILEDDYGRYRALRAAIGSR